MESRCHLGKVARYDTVSKLGWSVDSRTHGIKTVIDHILKEDWDPDNGVSVPTPEEEADCVVCPSCLDFSLGRF
jgi:putative lipase involved disintegration of autophagic bodies